MTSLASDEIEDTEPQAVADVARPAICRAALSDYMMICERCGLDWPAGTAGPKCSPITFEALHRRMLSEVTRAEVSLVSVLGLQGRGVPTDGGRRARRRLAELNAVLRMVERITGNAGLKAMLSGKKA
jgi:hypothetical protein